MILRNTPYLFSFLLLLVFVSSGVANLTCPRALGNHVRFEVDVPHRTSLSICAKQSSFTCCTWISEKAIAIEYASCVNAGASPECCYSLRNLLCASCSGALATGLIKGVCRNQCTQLALSCMNDFFRVTDGLLQFCSEDELICSPLSSIFSGDSLIENASELCESYGYVPTDSPLCYSGEIEHPPQGVTLAYYDDSHLRPTRTQIDEASSISISLQYLVPFILLLFLFSYCCFRFLRALRPSLLKKLFPWSNKSH